MTLEPCEHCSNVAGEALWRDDFVRVVLVSDPDHAGFTRVIVNRHVCEMTDLDRPERERLMCVVFAVERALRELLQPHKINLASLGNVVPHLHWHVIPRWPDDAHFPSPIWAPTRRVGARRPLPDGFAAALAARIGADLRAR